MSELNKDQKMEVIIIPLETKHLSLCIELDQKTFKGLWTKSQWEREIRDPKRICLGAFESERLLALCSGWFILNELHITVLVVSPLHLRKGLGTLILSNIIDKAKRQGVNKIILEVKETNEPAKALYKNLGFKITGHRLQLYRDGSNGLIFMKNLI